MGRDRLSDDAYFAVRSAVTKGGTTNATSQAEERMRKGNGIDPLVDPKGPTHLGPVRMSLPRFEKKGNRWILTCGIPMPKESLLDTTGSMGNNVDIAFDVLPQSYTMLTGGSRPILGRYDVQIANASFNDTDDNVFNGIPVLFRTQFEMAEKIASQMALIAPGREGKGNGKEDPEFGLCAAAYLTKARITDYDLKWYHFTVSDEPVVPTVSLKWLKLIFGDDVLDRIKENGYDFSPQDIPDTRQVVKDLQERAHAFFLQVGNRTEVTSQWNDLYGPEHFVMLPGGTTHWLHYVEAVIIGLTEGVLDLKSAVEFLKNHKLSAAQARQIVEAVSDIPIGAQMMCPNFDKIPKAGDIFKSKTDLWPVGQDEAASEPDSDNSKPAAGPLWKK